MGSYDSQFEIDMLKRETLMRERGYYPQYSNRMYYNRGYNRNRNRNRKKSSSANYIAEAKNGKACVTAKKYMNGIGLVSFLCAPYHKTEKRQSEKSEKVFYTWLAHVTKPMSREERFPCLYYPATGTVIISDLGLSINTKKGFVSTLKKRN